MSVILLEHPRPGNPKRLEEVVNAPLSACLFTGYVASVLQKNVIGVEIVHARLCDWSLEQTATYLSKKPFRLLCVHAIYLWEKTRDVFALLSNLRARNITAHINLYGYYPTFAYKNILECFPCVDSITVGEPEITILDLARCLLSKEDVSSQMNIPGLAVRGSKGQVVFHQRPPVHDLDQLPFPDRQDISLCQKKGIVAYIQGSRGCYGQCTFCYLNSFFGEANQWRGRSAKNIFDEVYELFTKHTITNFYFSDANFFGPGKAGKERAITLAELILANNLDVSFGFECRANDIDEYSISRLVMAGLTNVFLGLESGDPASLKRLRKHLTVDDNKKAIHLLRGYGIEPTFGFIMFEPHSTMESVRNNFEFLKEMNIMTTPAVTAHLLHHRQTLFQGTPDYQTVIPDTSCSDRDTSCSTYEALYTIRDQKVEAFSEIITRVCSIVLSLLPTIFNCAANTSLTSKMSGTSALAILNNTLITIFENALLYFETHENPHSPEAMLEMSQRLTYEVGAVTESFSLLHNDVI
ncbi:MAG: B12-binding domain-containing radical SAM protein [Candidatus Brocadia sp. WS118]|nr:MAG: B12-binding domain-containing radical SAM protein [Candidatus Brocadia sp. WS118]